MGGRSRISSATFSFLIKRLVPSSKFDVSYVPNRILFESSDVAYGPHCDSRGSCRKGVASASRNFFSFAAMIFVSISSLSSVHLKAPGLAGSGICNFEMLPLFGLSLDLICLLIVRCSSVTVKERIDEARFAPYTSSITSARSEINCSLYFFAFGFRDLYLLMAAFLRILISS